MILRPRRIALFAILGLVGCTTEALDYETALTLVKERTMEPLKITISASPRFTESDPKIKEYYDQLIAGHVLTCEANGLVGVLCQPGPAGEGVSPEGSTDLSVIAGHWAPAVITRINRAGRGAVTAELRLSFEPSALYREYQGAFDTIQTSSSSRVSLVEQKEGKTAHVSFVHAEDGWHVENIQ
jgi:hypothetical protein